MPSGTARKAPVWHLGTHITWGLNSKSTSLFHGITKTCLLVNRQAAEAVGLRIPESLARRAEPWSRN